MNKKCLDTCRKAGCMHHLGTLLKFALNTTVEGIPCLLASRKDAKKLDALLQPMKTVGAYRDAADNKIRSAARASAAQLEMSTKRKPVKGKQSSKAKIHNAKAKVKAKAGNSQRARHIEADTLTFKDMDNSLNDALKDIPQDCNTLFDHNFQEVKRKMARLVEPRQFAVRFVGYGQTCIGYRIKSERISSSTA